MVVTHTGPLCRVSLNWDLKQVCSRRAVTPKHNGVDFGVKHGKKPVSKLTTFCRCLCTVVEEQQILMAPAGSFVPRKAMPPLPDALQEGGTVSFSVFQGILRSCHLLWSICPPSPQEQCCALGAPHELCDGPLKL